ncbi:MAG: transporter [Ignavibacteria bacterium]
MKKFVYTIYTFVTLFVFVNSSFAQVEPISPDRPDQTESPNVIPLKSFQFEAGFVYEKNSQSGSTVKNYSYPSVLMRYGVLNNLELRMQVENTNETTEENGLSSSKKGISPVSLGFKMNACDEKGLRPAIGFEINFTLPNLASKELKNNFTGTSILLAMQNSITDNFSAGYNLGASWDGNTAEPTFFYTLSLGYEFSKRVSGFAEVYGFMPEKTRADHRFDFGLSFLALNNLAFDASAGLRITDNAPDYFVNGGFSFRLPK